MGLISRFFEVPKRLVGRYPFISFLVSLGFLVGLIVWGDRIGSEELPSDQGRNSEAIEVSVYDLAQASQSAVKVTTQAQVETASSLRVFAQQAGVVQKVNYREGDLVKAGGVVVNLASTYTGENAAMVSRELAENAYQNVMKTYGIQKELIVSQRQIAQKQAENTEKLREIAEISRTDIEGLTSLNVELLGDLNLGLEQLETDPTGNAEAIFQTKSQIAQLESALLQLRAQYRGSALQAAEDLPAAELAQLGKDATLRQLEVQEIGLEIAKRSAELQLKLAKIQEGLMMPRVSNDVYVERVYVREGQIVNAGMPLFQIRFVEGKRSVKVTGLVNKDVAERISILESIEIGDSGSEVELEEFYVSSTPTDGVMYSVSGYLEDDDLVNGTYLEMRLPVATQNESGWLVPVEATYQAQDGAYVYVIEKNDDSTESASVRKVRLGKVIGKYVEILEGLEENTKIIMDRTVLEGDLVVAG